MTAIIATVMDYMQNGRPSWEEIAVRRVYVSSVFDQSVDEVWAVLGDFHRVDRWMGIVHASEPEHGDQAPTIGSVRKLTVGDDRHTTRERLLAYDALNRQMTYELPPRFGMTEYLGTIRVLPVTDSGKTFIEWYGEYACDSVSDVPNIEATLTGLYTTFLGDLRRYLDSAQVSLPDGMPSLRPWSGLG